MEVIGDALACVPPAIDILYSSAGLGPLPPAWLTALKPGGRMVVPITDRNNHGLIFLLHKIAEDRPWTVKAQSFTRHYPCLGTRQPGHLEAFSAVLAEPGVKVASLRFGRHEKDASCWLHGVSWCLSAKAP